MYQTDKHFRPGHKCVSVALALLMILALLLPCAVPAAAAGDQIVMVTSIATSIHKGAGTNHEKIANARIGAVFDYIGSDKDSSGNVWHKIKYSSSVDGWIQGSHTMKTSRSVDCTQTMLDRLAKQYGATGVQAAVIKNGVVTETFNYGWATKGSQKMNSDHKIRVASLSKVAVAICAMKMQEQGIVNINKNIGSYWEAKPYKAVTLKSLLSHTSTLKDLSYTNKTGTRSQLELSGSYVGGRVGAASTWCYNNYAVGVAGSTLEVASRQTLNKYAVKHIFDPLSMDASFSSGLLKSPSRLATLYYSGGSVARSTATARAYKGNSTPGNNTNLFAGGLTCSAKDYAKLIAMLANDGTYNGTRILSPESVAAIEARLFSTSEHGGNFSQCMPLRYKVNLYGQTSLYYHTGNAYGVLALASYNPSTKNGVVVVTTGASASRDGQGVYRVCSSISEFLYRYRTGTVSSGSTVTTTTTTAAVPITTTAIDVTTTSPLPLTTTPSLSITTTPSTDITTAVSTDITTIPSTTTDSAETTASSVASTSVPTTTVPVAEGPACFRMSGPDRYATAFDICDTGWTRSDFVYLANGSSYADALAGVPLAALDKAPILLTANGANGIESGIMTRLGLLETKNVIILGGENVVSPLIMQQLIAGGYNTERISGSNRYETSLEIAKRIDGKGTPSGEVFFVSGENFPDALSAGSPAALKGAPIVYLPRNGSANSRTLDYLNSSGKDLCYIIGGEGAVSSSVAASISDGTSRTAKRICGKDRYDTSLEVFKYFSDLYSGISSVSFATGENFPDALTGSAFAANIRIPLLLISNTRDMTGLSKYLRNSYDISSVYAFGDSSVVSDGILRSVFPGLHCPQ